MAKKIKDYYDLDCTKMIAEKIDSVYTNFNSKGFIKYLKKELPKNEFSGRMDLFVQAFEKYLPNDYEHNLDIFYNILGEELETTEGMFITGWWLWPVGRYVEKHGTKNFIKSMKFIYELTKRFTGEFAVRPLIAQNPEKALKIILKWSKDKNVHVRRLASEGLRTKLPWAKKSYSALEQFDLYKQILTNLKEDKEKFVQKSVGNNLNDLMKDFPVKANEIISEWENDNPTKETLWIIKHGRRSLKDHT